jgi:hypothetical protein
MDKMDEKFKAKLSEDEDLENDFIYQSSKHFVESIKGGGIAALVLMLIAGLYQSCNQSCNCKPSEQYSNQYSQSSLEDDVKQEIDANKENILQKLRYWEMNK